MHFHVCVVDGVFEAVAGNADDDADAQATSPDVIFQSASAIDDTAAAQVQATLRRRILRACVGRGLLESFKAKDMLGYQHSGFSVNASVCLHPRARPRWPGALAEVLRPPTLCHGPAAQKRAQP